MRLLLLALCATVTVAAGHAKAEQGDGLVRGTITELDARPVFPMAGACAEILVSVDQAFFGAQKGSSPDRPRVTSGLLLMQVDSGYAASEWLLDGGADLLPPIDAGTVQACQTAIDGLGDDDGRELGRLNLKKGAEDTVLVSLLADKMSWRFDPEAHTIWYSLGPPNRAWPVSALFESEVSGRPERVAFQTDKTVASAADTAAVRGLLEDLVKQPRAQYDTWPYLLGAVILSSAFAVCLTFLWLQARSNRSLLMQLVKAGEARAHDSEQKAASQVNRIADYLVQETRALAANVYALDQSLRSGRHDQAAAANLDEVSEEEASAHWEQELTAQRSDHADANHPADTAKQAAGFVPELWFGQRSGSYDLEALIQIYNSWLLSDRDMKDFPLEMGLVEANGVRYRAAEPYGALLLPQGSGSGISLFVLALSSEEAVGLPGADMVVGSFRSAALRERSKPFFNVEIGKSVRLRVVKPCTFLQQDDSHCVLTEPGILTAKA